LGRLAALFAEQGEFSSDHQALGFKYSLIGPQRFRQTGFEQ
jgi:hypothetical protein